MLGRRRQEQEAGISCVDVRDEISRFTFLRFPAVCLLPPSVWLFTGVICVICGLGSPKIGLYLDGLQSHNTAPITGQGAGERV